VETAKEADYIIGASTQKKEYTEMKKEFFSWSAFLAWILSFLGNPALFSRF
jgi:hypothetical protein